MSTCQRWWQDLRPRLCIWAPAPHWGQVCLERHAASSAPARHTWSSNHDFSKRLREYLSYVRSSLWIGILRMSWPKVALMISFPVKSSLLKLPSIWEQSLVWSPLQAFEVEHHVRTYVENIDHCVTAAELIFTELNELEYITVFWGGDDGMSATEIRNTTGQCLKVCSSHAKSWSLRPVLWTSAVPFDFSGHFKHWQSTLMAYWWLCPTRSLGISLSSVPCFRNTLPAVCWGLIPMPSSVIIALKMQTMKTLSTVFFKNLVAGSTLNSSAAYLRTAVKGVPSGTPNTWKVQFHKYYSGITTSHCS